MLQFSPTLPVYGVQVDQSREQSERRDLQLWDTAGFFPPASMTDFRSLLATSSASFGERQHQPTGRTRHFQRRRGLDWNTHKELLRRLYMDGDKTLHETDKIMRQKYSFNASHKQYKDKFRSWGWQKNLPGNAAKFMLWKLQERKRVCPGKDTVFFYGGKNVGLERIRESAKRTRRAEPNCGGDKMPQTPRGVSYQTPPPSPPLAAEVAFTSPVTAVLNLAAAEAPAANSDLEIVQESHMFQGTRLDHGINSIITPTSLRADEVQLGSWLGCRGTLPAVRPDQPLENLMHLTDVEQFFEADKIASHGQPFPWCWPKSQMSGSSVSYTEADKVVLGLSVEHFQDVYPKPTDSHASGGFNIHRTGIMYDQICNSSGIPHALSSPTVHNEYQRQSTPWANPQEIDKLALAQKQWQEVKSLTDSLVDHHQDLGSLLDRALLMARTHIFAGSLAITKLLRRIVERCASENGSMLIHDLRAHTELLLLCQKASYSIDQQLVATTITGLKTSLALLGPKSTVQQVPGIFNITKALIGFASTLLMCDLRAAAADIFTHFACEANRVFGPANDLTIQILTRTGKVYQDHLGWSHAQEWFEQALAALLNNCAEDENGDIWVPILATCLQHALKEKNFPYSSSSIPVQMFGCKSVRMRREELPPLLTELPLIHLTERA